MLVDDELLIRKTLQKVFLSRGHEVLSFSDGKEALDRWLDFKPDLVILDVLMPQKGGVEVLKELSLICPEELVRSVIIMISAYSAGERREDFIELGANGFFRKPFDNVFNFVDQCLGFMENTC